MMLYDFGGVQADVGDRYVHNKCQILYTNVLHTHLRALNCRPHGFTEVEF